MAAGNVDLIIDQGEDFTAQIYWTDYNDDPRPLTAPMSMDIKSPYGQTVAHLYTPDVDWPDDQIEPIKYNTDTGWLQIHIPATTTDTMPAGNYSYDLWVTVDSGKVKVEQQTQTVFQSVRLLQGKVTVNKRITATVANV